MLNALIYFAEKPEEKPSACLPTMNKDATKPEDVYLLNDSILLNATLAAFIYRVFLALFVFQNRVSLKI